MVTELYEIWESPARWPGNKAYGPVDEYHITAYLKVCESPEKFVVEPRGPGHSIPGVVWLKAHEETLSNQISPILVSQLYEVRAKHKVTLNFGGFTITVMRRVSDWWACLNGHEGVWCCGPSLDYVIGYTIVTMIGEQQYITKMKDDPDDVGLREHAEWILTIDHNQIEKWNQETNE